MPHQLSPFSIYTTHDIRDLEKVMAGGGSGGFNAAQRWVTGWRLFAQARQNEERMPVLFAASAGPSELRYWATLTAVELHKTGTSYHFDNLAPLYPPLPRSALIKRSDDQPLSENVSRPYAIVYTPSLLRPA